jgi:hypothetical protein
MTGMDNVIPFPYTPSPERMREIFALADAYWPEYERMLEERERVEHVYVPRLRVVK